MFKFATLQETTGQALLKEYNINPTDTDSIILIDDKRARIKSTAALHVAKHLSGGWPVLYVFMIVPTCIRNWVYDYVARNRYNWYGKKDSCMIPTPELKDRFL